MKWSNIQLIFFRELRDQLRDRRTILTIAVLPMILYPLMGIGFTQIAQFGGQRASRILVVGGEGLPNEPALLVDDHFAGRFCSEGEASLIELTTRMQHQASDRELAQQEVKSGRFDAVVFFPGDFADKLRSFQDSQDATTDSEPQKAPQPEIVVNGVDDDSRVARQRLLSVLARWRQALVAQNLEQSQLPPAATEPFQLNQVDVAGEKTRRAAIWSKILPFVVLVWALTGAFYPAIDLCAGEKERGTLETILCSPAHRGEIVFGKLLTVMAFSIVSSLLNMGALGATGYLIIGQVQTVSWGPPPLSAIGWIMLALIPISLMFSALSLAIAVFARGTKEGQYYLMPLLLITLPLMILSLLPSVRLTLGTSLIPVTGTLLLLRNLIEGHVRESLLYVIPVLGTTTICSLLAVRWAIRQFNTESVLFRGHDQWELRCWLKHWWRSRGTAPTAQAALICALLLLVVRFFIGLGAGLPSSWSAFATSQLISQLALIAAPVVLLAILLTRRPDQALLLRRSRPASILMAALLAVAVHPVAMLVSHFIGQLYPMSPTILAQVQQLGALIQQAPLWQAVCVVALLPAICEELAFRGFVLSGLNRPGRRVTAVIVSSLLFGITHGMLQQSMSAFAVGLLLGYIAVQSRSLLPCIAFHFVYNSLSVLIGLRLAVWTQHVTLLERLFVRLPDGTLLYHPVAVLAGTVVGLAVIAWFRQLPWVHRAARQQPAMLEAGRSTAAVS